MNNQVGRWFKPRILACEEWDQKALSEASGVPLTTLKRAEAQAGNLAAHGRTIAALQSALESVGITFINGGEPGVKLRRRPDQPTAETDQGG